MLSRPHPGSARPFGAAAVRRGLQATCRPSASATECPPSTPTDRPILPVDHGKPCSRRATRPLTGPAGRASSGRGSLGFGNRVDPHHGDRSPWWIYPNLTDPGTPTREPVSNPAWKSFRARRSCGGDLFRTDPPACGASPAGLLEPPPVVPREREPRTAAPEVPSALEVFAPKLEASAPRPPMIRWAGGHRRLCYPPSVSPRPG